MSIDISQEHRDFVREELENGHFASEQALIDEAIELLRSRRGVLGKLKNGIEQLERGEGSEYGSQDRQRFIAEMRAEASLDPRDAIPSVSDRLHVE